MRILPGLAVMSLGIVLAFLVAQRDHGAGRVVWKGYPQRTEAILAARSGLEYAMLSCFRDRGDSFRSSILGEGRFEARWQEAGQRSPEPFEGRDCGRVLRTLPRRALPVEPETTGFWHWLGFGEESPPLVLAPPRERSWWISGRGSTGDAVVSLQGSVVIRD
ncbi:MAG: hypothetical protein AB7F75_11820 [Planctomycetota bacterium]